MNLYVRDTCKIGQGRECCRYLTMGQGGFCCEKLGSLKSHLDHATQMTARGDNCDGLVEMEYRVKLRGEDNEHDMHCNTDDEAHNTRSGVVRER